MEKACELSNLVIRRKKSFIRKPWGRNFVELLFRTKQHLGSFVAHSSEQNGFNPHILYLQMNKLLQIIAKTFKGTDVSEIWPFGNVEFILFETLCCWFPDLLFFWSLLCCMTQFIFNLRLQTDWWRNSAADIPKTAFMVSTRTASCPDQRQQSSQGSFYFMTEGLV